MGKKITDFLNVNVFKGDKALWVIYCLLCFFSLMTIYSASSRLTFGSMKHWEPLVSQFGFLLAGFLIIVLVSSIPCKYFKLVPLIGLPIAFCMLVYTLFLQQGVNDAARWMSIFGIRFQPSEIAKVMLVMAVAVVLSKLQKEEKVKNRKGEVKTVARATKGGKTKAFKIVSCMTAIICMCILPENFSTAMMLAFVIVVMMFIGNVPKAIMFKAIGACVLIGGLALSAMVTLPDSSLQGFGRAVTWKHRIESKLGLEEVDVNSQEYKDKTLQENMSKAAIAASEIKGVGVGNSTTRDFLPHAESDFIYSILVEETGLVGGIALLLLYVFLFIRAIRVAASCDRFFPAFLIMGLCILFVVQALVNISVAVGLLPVTGQTLPLISHGGTSILVTSFGFGMILSVSKYAQKVKEKREKETVATVKTYKLPETNEIYSSVGMV